MLATVLYLAFQPAAKMINEQYRNKEFVYKYKDLPQTVEEPEPEPEGIVKTLVRIKRKIKEKKTEADTGDA
jgi:hypothetical protein